MFTATSSGQERCGVDFFSRFELAMNGKLDCMNKAFNKALMEQKTSSEKATSELKQEILTLQKSVDGIVKVLEDKPASALKKKKIPNELSVSIFLPKINYLCGCIITGCGQVSS